MANNTKSIDDILSDASKGDFKKTLSALNLTTLGIGAIIGTGIFVLTGTAAANYAGPAIVLSFIFSGLACAFAALCYAEFASMIPISGSAYTYAFATMGQLFAWIIGWDLILEYLFAASTVAVGWSGYVVSFLHDLGVHVPPSLTYATGTDLINVPTGLPGVVSGWQPLTEAIGIGLEKAGLTVASLEHVTAVMNLPAMLIVALTTTLLVFGIKESASVNNVIVIIKVGVVLAFIAFGLAYINMDNWSPFIPANEGDFGKFGWSGILRGSGVIFFAYIGFDAVSTAAQESKNPQRDMPIGIIGSLVVCTVLYILVALVMTGIVNYRQLAVAAPIALAIDTMGAGMAWLRPLVKIGAIAGLSSVILVMLLGQPRIFYAMAKDGLMPASFAKLHPKYKTPFMPTILTGLVALIIAGTVNINILGELVSIGTLLAFAMVCAGILVLRKTRPDIPRPFKTPWVPVVPILGILTAVAQMVALPYDTWLRLLIWMAIGVAIYFLYGKANARKVHDLRREDEQRGTATY